MVNIKKQTIFSILIGFGAILLLYDIATQHDILELKIVGLVVLMIGLYGSTRQWVDDNKHQDSNEVTEEESSPKQEDPEKKQK